MKFVKIILVVLLYAGAALVGTLYLFPEKALETVAGLERSQSGLARKEIAAGGQQWVYLEGGQGEPLLLLHGFGADKDNFTRVVRTLTPKYRVIVPDLIGFGESSHPEDVGYTIEEQVERLRFFAQALGLTTVHLGGSSMGGYISATWAAKYPAEVSSLWLLAPAGVTTAPKSDLTTLLEQDTPNPLLVRNEDDFYTTFHFAMAEPPYVPEPLLQVMARRRVANFALEEKIFDAIRRQSTPLEKLVKGLPTPTRIVWGERDRALNVGGAKVLSVLMPNSSLFILPNIGHLPMIEQPKEVADDYLAFRATIQQ